MKEKKKLLSVISPTYQESENVIELVARVKKVFSKLSSYTYEHIFIDNASEDKTVPILKQLAKKDKKIKIIVNLRNYGFLKSWYHGLLQGSGVATILMLSDLQDPPELIPQLIEKWEKNKQVVFAVRKRTEESIILTWCKRFYYYFLNKISDVELVKNSNGFGIYDQKVIQELSKVNDPYPFFKGIISEIGFSFDQVEYKSLKRKKGKSSTNFLKLFDYSLIGITTHSNFPIRFVTFLGISMSFFSFLMVFYYVFIKLVYPEKIIDGLTSLHVLICGFTSLILFFIGVIGEYIHIIHKKLENRPRVLEKERINFLIKK